MDPKNRVTIDDLLKRKESFFVSYEVDVDMWDAENFDPEVDFFDLEDMLASRYWLKRLQAEGKLTKEEEEKLRRLEAEFYRKEIPEFVKEKFPGVYKRWITDDRGASEPVAIVGTDLVNLDVILEVLVAEKGWTGIVIPAGGTNEDNTLQPFAA